MSERYDELVEELVLAAAEWWADEDEDEEIADTLREAISEVMFERARRQLCAYCGEQAEGWAFINDDRYCHPDDDSRPDCYSLAGGGS